MIKKSFFLILTLISSIVLFSSCDNKTTVTLHGGNKGYDYAIYTKITDNGTPEYTTKVEIRNNSLNKVSFYALESMLSQKITWRDLAYKGLFNLCYNELAQHIFADIPKNLSSDAQITILIKRTIWVLNNFLSLQSENPILGAPIETLMGIQYHTNVDLKPPVTKKLMAVGDFKYTYQLIATTLCSDKIIWVRDSKKYQKFISEWWGKNKIYYGGDISVNDGLKKFVQDTNLWLDNNN